MLLSRTSSASNRTRYFRLPSGQVVPESALPSFGYVLYNHGGVRGWIHSSVLNQVSGQSSTAGSWQDVINQGFNFAQIGIDLVQELKGIFGNSWEDQVLDSTPGAGRNEGWA